MFANLRHEEERKALQRTLKRDVKIIDQAKKKAI